MFDAIPGFSTALDLAATQVSHEADQNRAHSDMVETHQFNAEQAGLSRDWQTMMSNTQYQRSRADMEAAGLNPILMASRGGAPIGSGGQATGSANTVYGGGPSMENTAQTMLQGAQKRQLDATTDRTQAEADAIRQTTPINIENTKAKTEEARAAAQALLQQAKTGQATAANLQQQTENLKAQLPVFEATVKNLRALTVLHGEQANLAFKQAGLTVQQGEALQQRLQQDLPKLEAAFLKLKTEAEKGPAARGTALSQVYGAGGGNQGALLEFLNALPIPLTFKTYNITN